MGDLRDQLKKAKLLSEKEARRVAHEQRVHRSEVGREGVEREQAERARELEALQQQQRARTRMTQEELERARRAEAELAACEEILRRETLRPVAGAGGRWYFELPDRRLPWIEVTEGQRRSLGAGALCIVRIPGEDPHGYGLLPAEHARRVAKTIPDRIVWAVRGVVPRDH